MLLCVASPSQLLSACPSTQILTPISLSSPVPLFFLLSQLPRLLLFLTACQKAPYALVPVAQTLHDVSVAQVHPYASPRPKHPYVAVAQLPKLPGVATAQLPKLPGVAAAQLPPYATQPQKHPCVSVPQPQQRNVVAPTYLFVLATPSQPPVSQLSLSCQQCQPQS